MTRYLFANQLRGAAALCVVILHLGGLYWSERQLVADGTFSALQTAVAPAFAALFTNPWFNPGSFGVALFFLISGFVIPMSLDRRHPDAFLIARFFRIFPTYWVALAIELLVIAISAWYWHRSIAYDAKVLLANVFLVNDIVWVPSIDFVNWTLNIELKFYLLMTLLVASLRRGSVLTLLGVAAFTLFVNRFSDEISAVSPGLDIYVRTFESNALYVVFMLIGVAFSFHVRGLIDGKRLWACVVLLFAAFVACWPLTFLQDQFPYAPANYGYALVLFGIMYVFRNAARETPILDYFAAISYPLYLVHFLVGATLMQFLIAWHLDATLATLLAFAAVIGLATVLHYTVELRSQAFGKTLSQRA